MKSSAYPNVVPRIVNESWVLYLGPYDSEPEADAARYKAVWRQVRELGFLHQCDLVRDLDDLMWDMMREAMARANEARIRCPRCKAEKAE